MTTYTYKPDHPQADEFGMVDKSLLGTIVTNKGPYVISDNMDATRHMANGHMYTSKAAFRQATKDAGCIEIGNDSSLTRPRRPVGLDRTQRKYDIKRAIDELKGR